MLARIWIKNKTKHTIPCYLLISGGTLRGTQIYFPLFQQTLEPGFEFLSFPIS